MDLNIVLFVISLPFVLLTDTQDNFDGNYFLNVIFGLDSYYDYNFDVVWKIYSFVY